MRLEFVVAMMGMVVFASGPAATQTADDGDLAFGGTFQEYVVQASGCHENANTERWIHGNFGFYGTDSAAPTSAVCPVTLPIGARMTGIECVVRDASAAGDARIEMIRHHVDAAGVPMTGVLIVSVNSTGATGNQILTAMLAIPTTLPRHTGGERNIYSLLVTLPGSVADAAFRECAILYNRGVAANQVTETLPN